MQPDPPPPDPRPRPRAGTGLAIGGGIVALLAKGKVLFGLLKALPFAKVLLTTGSMALSMLVYAQRGGIAFAAGFIVLLLVHELGHGVAMKQAGVRAGWPVFIPMFGALIAMKDRPASASVEARIAYAGPLAGTAASLAAAGLGLLLHSAFFLALAYAGFFLNLFNLVPLGFLDGGRIARVFSRKAWIVGGLLMGGMFLMSPSPQLLIIGLLSAGQAFRRSNEDLGTVTDEERRAWALRYFGLAFFLGLATLSSHALVAKHGW